MKIKKVFSPEGELYDVPENEIAPLLEAGGRVASDEEVKNYFFRKEQQESSGIEAGVRAGVRSLTFGASDVIEKKFNELTGKGYTPEQSDIIKEESPLANIAGEIGGFLVPGPGPLKILGKAGKAAEKGVQALAKEVAGKEGVSLAKKILESKATEAIARETTENALYGGARALNEGIYREQDLPTIAENVMAEGGIAGLIGGGATGVFKGIGAASKATSDFVAPKFNKLLNEESRNASLNLAGVSKPKLQAYAKYDPDTKIPLIEDETQIIFRNQFDKDGNIVKPLTTIESISKADDISQIRTDAIKYKENVGKKFDPLTKEIQSKIDPNNNPYQGTFQKWINKIDEEIKILEEGGPKSLKIANQLTEFKDLGVKRFSQLPENFELTKKLKDYTNSDIVWDGVPSDYDKALRKVRYAVKDFQEKATEAIDPLLAKQLKDLNNKYHALDTLVKSSDDLFYKEMKTTSLTKTDMIAIASSVFSPLILVALGIKKGFDKYKDPAISILGNKNFKSMSKLNGMKESFDKKLDNSVTSFFKKQKPASLSVPSINTLMEINFREEKRQEIKDKNEAFKKMKEDIEELASNQEMLVNRLAENTAGISESAPTITMQMQTTASNAVAFLNQKLPKNPYETFIIKKDWKPSSIELAKFERYLTAVNNPLSVVEDLNKGFISREGVEALKMVYPNMYNQIVTKMTEKIADPENKISYKDKLQLSILLDIPVDEMTNPKFVASMQSVYVKDNQEEKLKTSNMQSGGNMANNSMTEAQRVANRS